MKVTFISDTHNRHRNLGYLEGGDLLVFAGDAMSSGYSYNELIDFITWFSLQNYKYKIFVAGNHDRYCESFPVNVIRDIFEKFYDKGVRYILDEEIEIDGLRIYGTPYQPYFCNWAFNVKDSDELTKIYEKIPNGLDILITHCPPYDILDKSHIAREYYGTTGEEPLGSKELLDTLNFIPEPPKYCVFGHIHGDGGKYTKIGNTTFINASVCDESYRPTNEIITLEV